MAPGFQLLPMATTLISEVKTDLALTMAAAKAREAEVAEETPAASAVAENEAYVPTLTNPHQVFSLFLNPEVYKVPAY